MNNPYDTTHVLKGIGLVGIDDVADRELQARDRRNADMDKQIEDLLSEYTKDPETIKQAILEVINATPAEIVGKWFNVSYIPQAPVFAELRSMAERYVEENQ